MKIAFESVKCRFKFIKPYSDGLGIFKMIIKWYCQMTFKKNK
jgi:hypothetical protein